MLIMYALYTCYIHINILENLSIGYSPVWRQLWAYNTHKIIGRGQSWRSIISKPISAPNKAVYYTMAIQTYPHSLLSNGTIIILISDYCKNCENTIRLFSPIYRHVMGIYHPPPPPLHQRLPW